MKPRVGSYGDTATVTRSPSTTRIRWRRTLPASLASTSCPFSSLTRKFPPLAIRMTSPSRCTSSSLVTRASGSDSKPPAGPAGAARHSTDRRRKEAASPATAPAAAPGYTCTVDRQPPRTTSNEIDLYIRTYYSLLRSSGDVRVRSFEEAHVWSSSSLHAGAQGSDP